MKMGLELFEEYSNLPFLKKLWNRHCIPFVCLDYKEQRRMFSNFGGDIPTAETDFVLTIDPKKRSRIENAIESDWIDFHRACPGGIKSYKEFREAFYYHLRNRNIYLDQTSPSQGNLDQYLGGDIASREDVLPLYL